MTFYNKKMGSAIDYLSIVERLFWQLGHALVAVAVNHSVECNNEHKLTQQCLIRSPTRLDYCTHAVKTKRGNYNVRDQKRD